MIFMKFMVIKLMRNSVQKEVSNPAAASVFLIDW